MTPSRRSALGPVDTSGGRAPTEAEFAAAREIVERSGVLPVLEARIDSPVGRPRSLSVQGFLVGAQLNALRRHHQAHLVEIARTLNALSPAQLELLGVRCWDPKEAYDRVARLFVKLVAALQRGWDADVQGTTVRIDAGWVSNRIAQASIPNELRISASLAVDGTDVETWGALRGDAETVEVDAETDDGTEEEDAASGSERRRGPRRRARVLGIGPDGRKVYTADPDARAGHRSSTNSRSAGPYIGFELHLAVQTRDVRWSDGIERVTLSQEVPPVVTNLALTAAGSHRANAVVPGLVAAKEAGQPIEDVVWDPGYSLCRSETAAHPLHRAGIHQTFRPVKHQRAAKPFSPDAILIEGHPFSTTLPADLAGQLPMPPRGASVQECLAHEEAFNRRARYRYTRHAGPDADGATRWRCPFCYGLLRSRALPLHDAAVPALPARRAPRGSRPVLLGDRERPSSRAAALAAPPGRDHGVADLDGAPSGGRGRQRRAEGSLRRPVPEVLPGAGPGQGHLPVGLHDRRVQPRPRSIVPGQAPTARGPGSGVETRPAQSQAARRHVDGPPRSCRRDRRDRARPSPTRSTPLGPHPQRNTLRGLLRIGSELPERASGTSQTARRGPRAG